MMVSIQQISKRFQENYSLLYEGEFSESLQRCLCDRGDELLKERKDIATALCDYNKDFISSDREAAAYALTLYDLNLV